MVDEQIAGAFDGWQRAVVAGAAGLIAANFPQLVKTYADHPLVSALGVYDSATGQIDIDSLYNAFVPQLGEDKLPISIPKIGVIKLGKNEFEILRQYIKES